jgi:hypothetical protein
MQDKKAILRADNMYHVYGRAVGSEILFHDTYHYESFLFRYQLYIAPIAELWSYSLMPNHFHFALQLKDEETLIKYYENKYCFKSVRDKLEKLNSRQFCDYFNSYAKMYNQLHDRKGSLFIHPFKRKRITEKENLSNVIRYIHMNPVVAGLCSNPSDYIYSSYRLIMAEQPSLVERNKVLDLFGGTENFREMHQPSFEDQLITHRVI